ncbi:MAG: hypothetical protein [Thorarchaeia virus VerdaV2]|uniref:Uncharacterized protein n=1 Tax=Thorarchaeia virus VerdaV2 TaxID=3070171 RepID=A0AA35GBP1_9CAUD|nr:MAG: hypothetical protein QIT42_gp10 [Thorarchaeia virus VerdaV2]BDI54904.1 MAG: hypothetical protein [Thorarchaeia virus VerdaV2]
MGKIEEYKIGEVSLKIFSRLPYRLECKLEELVIKMAEGMEGKLSDFEDMNISDMDISDLKGFDISKKMAINDFLLTNAILQPIIIEEDLGDYNHELNDYFKEIGDYLFDKYIAQYSEKTQVKKKLTKSPS